MRKQLSIRAGLQVVAEVTAAGLTHVTTADWPAAAHYAAVFRK